jgi:hypothetical protein
MIPPGGTQAGSGQVIIATQYNPSNSPFATKQLMENYDYANSGNITESLMHGVECDPNKNPNNMGTLYVRNALPSTYTAGDLKDYDMGFTSIATNGLTQTNLNVGEIWVEYTVKLRKSKQIQSQLYSVWQSLSDNSITATAKLGTAGSFTANTLGCYAPNTGSINLPVLPIGTRFMVAWYYTCGSTDTLAASTSTNSTMNISTSNNVTSTLAEGKFVMNGSNPTNVAITYQSAWAIYQITSQTTYANVSTTLTNFVTTTTANKNVYIIIQILPTF